MFRSNYALEAINKLHSCLFPVFSAVNRSIWVVTGYLYLQKSWRFTAQSQDSQLHDKVVQESQNIYNDIPVVSHQLNWPHKPGEDNIVHLNLRQKNEGSVPDWKEELIWGSWGSFLPRSRIFSSIPWTFFHTVGSLGQNKTLGRDVFICAF